MQFEMCNIIGLNGNEVRVVLLVNGDFQVKIVYKDGDRREATHGNLMSVFMFVEELLGKQTVIQLRKQMLDAVTNTQNVVELRNQLFRMEKIETVLNFQRQIDTYEEINDARE